jgi:hypothetical protein
MTTPASPRDPSLEQRTLDLQLQIEQVNATLQQIRQTHDSLQQMESRLSEMTSECAGILDRWAKNDERHATAVAELHSRLSEWNDLERKLLAESATRIHQFERGVHHEWQALRQKHEEPLQKLDAQAARVTENCLAAVDAALRGFDRAEARLQTVEQQVARQMTELVREVREALAGVRQPALAAGAPRSWPLEEVVRLHSELRAEASDEPSAADEGALTPRPVAPALADDRSQRKLLTAAADPEPPRRSRGWIAFAVAVAVLLTASVLHLRQRLDVALDAATTRAAAAERDAESARRLAREQIADAQRTAEHRIASAQQAAQSAQLTANVLAAPDLYRLDLAGTPSAPRAAAQVLWSRSRGIVFSGSRLPAAPDGGVYQLWMLTQEGPVAVGLLAPDSGGRVTAGFDPPARLPRPVIGASVTIEPAAGAAQPAGPVYLSSPPPPAS